MSRRPVVLALAVGLTATACAQRPTPQLELGRGREFIPVVVNALDDVGLFPSVAVDPDGAPVVVAFSFPEEVPEGEVAQARPLDAPTLPAVVIAARREGVWTRGAVAMPTDAPVAVPFGPQTVEDLSSMTAGNVAGTDVAVDGAGGIHVAWTADTGVWYASGDGTSFTVEPVQRLEQPLREAGPVGPPSVAVGEDGTAMVAFAAIGPRGEEVTLATRGDGSWEREVVATVEPAPVRAGPAEVAVVDGQPLVAYLDGGPVIASRRPRGGWSGEPVAGAAGASSGLSLAVDPDGRPWLASYAGNAVEVTGPDGTTSVAEVTGLQDAGELAGTGIAVDDRGTISVAWYDPGADAVRFAQGEGGRFRAVEATGVRGGAQPDVAAVPDGSAVFVAYFDHRHADLRLGAYEAARGLALARPTSLASPGGQPSPPPTSTPPTESPPPAQGTVVSVELGSLFINADPDQVPAGEVTFQATSDSFHELLVIATDDPPDQLATGPDGTVDVSRYDVPAEITPPFGPDAGVQSTSAKLDPGPYVLICNVPGHYQGGMYLGFQVTR
ncbi:MAG TPA: hypothetical protein VNO17_02945 [Actinomycetota bacterium]|nr:hypothetical protein [Actinomycetota bacterium]